ncbi:MAG: Ribbon-helix-helix protein, copG family [Syntrophorhabdus sp. PtaB.Bin047]|jgi:predicted transcriptional regulator|nr:MAG: Ribbon-helix-helix protein, copG family [Syntrophorhabdus sp. PtaB.Bin047]
MKEKVRPVLIDIDVSIRMPGDLLERLNDLAKATGRSRAYLATLAIEEFVATEERRVRAIREGMEDAEAGRVVDHSEALKELIPWGVRRR